MIFYFTYPTAYFPRYYLRQSFFARRGQLPMRSAVGFSDIKYFYKCFKEETGQNLSEYRKM